MTMAIRISKLIALLILSTGALAQVDPDTAHFWRSPRWYAGVRINNALPYGTLGFLVYPKPAWSIATSIDLGGNQVAGSTLLMRALYRRPSTHIYVTLGPNLEDLETNPDYENPKTILSLASGVAARIRLNKTLDLHLAIAYLTPASPPKPFKLAIAVSAPFE